MGRTFWACVPSTYILITALAKPLLHLQIHNKTQFNTCCNTTYFYPYGAIVGIFAHVGELEKDNSDGLVRVKPDSGSVILSCDYPNTVAGNQSKKKISSNGVKQVGANHYEKELVRESRPHCLPEQH